jgi:hypothetical protein
LSRDINEVPVPAMLIRGSRKYRNPKMDMLLVPGEWLREGSEKLGKN